MFHSLDAGVENEDFSGSVDFAPAPHSDKWAEVSKGQLEVMVSLRAQQAVAGDLRAEINRFVEYLNLLAFKVDHFWWWWQELWQGLMFCLYPADGETQKQSFLTESL